jgi:hypothetical protein
MHSMSFAIFVIYVLDNLIAASTTIVYAVTVGGRVRIAKPVQIFIRALAKVIILVALSPK